MEMIKLLLKFSAAIIRKMITPCITIHGYLVISKASGELQADSQLGIEKMRLIFKLTKQHYESAIEEDVMKAYYQEMLVTLEKEVSTRQKIANLALQFATPTIALAIQEAVKQLEEYWQNIEELSLYYPSND